MATNKVIFGGETVIDLTTDTLVSSDQLKKGIVAHTKDGNVVTGTLSPISNGKITIDSELNDDGTQTIIINEDLSLKNNALALAIDENDESYFKGLGYQIGKTLGSDGSESDQGDCFVTGFIPFTAGMAIELENILLAADDTVDGYDYKYMISVYDENKTEIETNLSKELLSYSENVVEVDGSYITQFTLKKLSSSIDISNMAYIRISGILSGNPAIYLLDYVDTNLLALAEDKNGNPYNDGIGYKENTGFYLDGNEYSKSGTNSTGYIPFKIGDTIKLINVIISSNYVSEDNSRIVFFNDSKKYIQIVYGYKIGEYSSNIVKVDENNNVTEFTINEFSVDPYSESTDINDTSFIRFSWNLQEGIPEIYRRELAYVY